MATSSSALTAQLIEPNLQIRSQIKDQLRHQPKLDLQFFKDVPEDFYCQFNSQKETLEVQGYGRLIETNFSNQPTKPPEFSLQLEDGKIIYVPVFLTSNHFGPEPAFANQVFGSIQLIQEAAAMFYSSSTEANSDLFKKIIVCAAKRTNTLNAKGSQDHQLFSLPNCIGSLKHLTSLILSCNQLERLPESIGELTGLSKLDVSDNRLTQLPETIFRLDHLKRLYADNNQLTSVPSFERLPEGFDSTTSRAPYQCLVSLTKLRLRHNQLTTLPEGLDNRPNLKELKVDGNPFEELPLSWTQLNSKLTIDFTDHNLTAEKIRAFMALLQSRRDEGCETATFTFEEVS